MNRYWLATIAGGLAVKLAKQNIAATNCSQGKAIAQSTWPKFTNQQNQNAKKGNQMGKNSKFERMPRDYYKTPESAVLPLLPHIAGQGLIFAEPCAGDGQLMQILCKHGQKCGHSSDIEPQVNWMQKIDALQLVNLLATCDIIITNPPWEKRPWKGEIFNKLLRHWLATFVGNPNIENNGDIWLLFDADWMHTQQAREFMPYCKKIVSVGRVKWFPGTDHDSKDNCAWYCFNANHNGTPPLFYGRQAQ